MSAAGSAQNGTRNCSSPAARTLLTEALPSSACAYSPCGSITTIFAACHPPFTKPCNRDATALVFPEPVDPTMEAWRTTKRDAPTQTGTSSAAAKRPTRRFFFVWRRGILTEVALAVTKCTGSSRPGYEPTPRAGKSVCRDQSHQAIELVTSVCRVEPTPLA